MFPVRAFVCFLCACFSVDGPKAVPLDRKDFTGASAAFKLACQKTQEKYACDLAD